WPTRSRARPAPSPTTRCTATRSGPRAPAAPPTWGWRRPTPTRWSAASAAAGTDAGRASDRGRRAGGRGRRLAGRRVRGLLPAPAGGAARPAGTQWRRQDDDPARDRGRAAPTRRQPAGRRFLRNGAADRAFAARLPRFGPGSGEDGGALEAALVARARSLGP